MANEQNLKRGNPETQITSGRMALEYQKKSVESRNINTAMRKRLEQIVKMTLKEGRADKIKNIAEAKGANLTVSDALLVKLVTMALGGNMKAMSELMGLLGMYSPAPPEATQEQSSNFINALNDSAEEVWANEAPEKE